MSVFLGMDIGGTGMKAALVDTAKGELVTERHRIETPQPATPAEMAKVAKKLVKHFDYSGHLGIGFPSRIINGVTKTAVNIDKSWIDCDAAGVFSKATGCEVQILNDADVAGLAEMRWGAGVGHQGCVLMLTIGTGIGSALFIDGIMVPNVELGSMRLDTGKIGEKTASGAVRDREGLKWKDWAKRFQKYLNEVEVLLAPELIILGGGAGKKFDKYSEYITSNADLVVAKLRNEAGIVGAAMAAKEAAAKVDAGKKSAKKKSSK